MSKTDLSDGFYQMHLTPTGALKLAVPFHHEGKEPMVAIPTRLPMGWTESPPAFSAVTETVADLINESLERDALMPPAHPLKTMASKFSPLVNSAVIDAYPVVETGPIRPPLAYIDVYVDDFIKLAQGWWNALRVRRQTFHHIDKVFRPNDALDQNRKEPISLKKLEKGDDGWSTEKVILGWLVDSLSKTISLPQHRQERLESILQKMLRRKRASVTEWQQILGELHSMSLALPGSKGCFSILQDALGTAQHRV